jgi:SAM-dependent methyltransferase
MRPNTVSEELEESERLWWQRFAEVEDRFCWVQTPEIQKTLRGHYLRKILEHSRGSGRILELGCGTGWMCLLLAKMGAKDVVGVDFAESQITLANKEAARLELEKSVVFHCVDGTKDHLDLGKFDVVIAHGFLHHLTADEIRSTVASVPSMLTTNGVFIVFEPSRDVAPPSNEGGQWHRRLIWLRDLAKRGKRWGLRKYSDKEISFRETISARQIGVYPHGPSPKEMPFEKGELLGFLEAHFLIKEVFTCMTISHLVAQEWLLRELSHPISTRVIMPTICRLASYLESCALGAGDIPQGTWTLDMHLCRKR